MSALFVLAGLAAGLLLLLCPLIALLLVFDARNRVKALEHSTEALKRELARLNRERATAGAAFEPAAEQPAAQPPPPPPAPEPTLQPPPAETKPPVFDWRQALAEEASPAEAPPLARPAEARPAQKPKPDPWLEAPPKPRPPTPPPAWLIQAKAWLFGGNLVAKLGLMILFIGVGFLLKYAAARVTVPIELRLASIALADLGLLRWAWRIRERRPAISLPAQGAAVAILMLVVFGAFRLYGLIPAGAAFALLFLLTAATCALALLQDALWLAVFGIAGGFAVPIVTSTGGGSHIALFSYYALLNAGILGLAWRRAWRLLNWLGFLFTFLIATAWGVLRYSPADYPSAQAFLLLFFGFYVLIAVLYALKQAPRLKHYVDGSLVFGTPLAGFGLQYGLVKSMPFGPAFSALALGLFYGSLAALLWQKRGTTLKLLAESFLALAVIFGSLAIPFALDGRWTSAAWALEGAGMVWVGLRQKQTLAWMFGLLVQFGAWVSFLGSASGLDAAAAVEANLWLGFLLLAATAFGMAVNFRAQDGRLARFAAVFLGVAAVWMLAGAWTEIVLRTQGAALANGLAASGLIVAALLAVAAWRLRWPVAQRYALWAQALAGLAFLALALLGGTGDAYANGLFLGALLISLGAGFSAWFFHRQADPEFADLSDQLLVWAGFWWFFFVLRAWADWLARLDWYHDLVEPNWAKAWPWDSCGTGKEDLMHLTEHFWNAYGLGLALSALGFSALARRLDWPQLRWPGCGAWLGLAVSSAALLNALYIDDGLTLKRDDWWAWLALWGVGEWLLRFWQANGWKLADTWLKILHTVRTAGPWLMIWPLGRYWIAYWLHVAFPHESRFPTLDRWPGAGGWSWYLPTWVMMLAVAWAIRRVRDGGWPVAPIAGWYRHWLIPLGAGWMAVLVTVWNFSEDGSMVPLPYMPILNPLDLTSGFALWLGLAASRQACEPLAATEAAAWKAKALLWAGLAAYGWFNLMLLRSVAHYLDIPYRFGPLFDSQFAQTLLSLVWTATALVLMRSAARRLSRKAWMLGAALLGVAVAKLFFVDLSNVGGLERIVSFVGVGGLMVAIGYLAPLPSEAE